MKKTSIQELTRMVCDLPVNGNIYVKQHADSELFGITCSNLFESDLVIISRFGGGFASLFNTSTTNEGKEMCSWLQYALGTDNSGETVYLLTEYEVYGKQPLRHTLNKPAVLAFTERSIDLRDDIINNIVSVLKVNGLSEIELDMMVREPTFVLWCDEDGNWYDSPVKQYHLTLTASVSMSKMKSGTYPPRSTVKTWTWLLKILTGSIVFWIMYSKLLKQRS